MMTGYGMPGPEKQRSVKGKSCELRDGETVPKQELTLFTVYASFYPI